jgi:hypothetical protein
MQTKVTMILALGFILSLGLLSCASVENHRSVASDSAPHYANSDDSHEERTACRVGEERNEDGDCVRPHNFDHPFRRGGR